VAKEVLRWNDHVIHLFWDMVSLSTHYVSRDSPLAASRQNGSLDFEHVAIFLVLHLYENTPSTPSQAHTPHTKTPGSPHTPTAAYEDVWPSAAPAMSADMAEPGSPQTSPNRDSDRALRKTTSGTSTGGGGPVPVSPRSPKASQSPANKRMTPAVPASAKTPRSNAQYLHSVRQKIPMILRSLSIDQQDESTLMDLTLSVDNPGNPRNGGGEGSGGTLYSSMNFSVDFQISRKTVDALGLIVCGGYSRDQAVSHLSSLFPAFHAHGESDHVVSPSRERSTSPGDGATTIPFSELSAWINVHMSMNDILYPVSISPSYGAIPCSPTSRDMSHAHISAMSATDADAAKEAGLSASKGQQPMRSVNPVSSLSRAKPTIINGCSTTVVHVVGGSLMSAKNSFRKMKSMSRDNSEAFHSSHDIKVPHGVIRNEHGLSDSDSEKDKTSPVAHTRQRNHSLQSDSSYDEHGMYEFARSTEDIESLMRNNTNYLSHPEQMLPPLFLNLCTKAKLYLISPYHSASITGCSDCEIVIGAVFGAVILSGCERVQITCACRKLVIISCVDCAFNVATLTTTIITGDCRNNTIGCLCSFPFNLSSRNNLAISRTCRTVQHRLQEPAKPSQTGRPGPAALQRGAKREPHHARRAVRRRRLGGGRHAAPAPTRREEPQLLGLAVRRERLPGGADEPHQPCGLRRGRAGRRLPPAAAAALHRAPVALRGFPRYHHSVQGRDHTIRGRRGTSTLHSCCFTTQKLPFDASFMSVVRHSHARGVRGQPEGVP
jgi:hypothetical protein